jgi:para-nitrobenzyl esterase
MFALLFLPILAIQAFPWDPKVKTKNGVVEGFTDIHGVHIFHSIPFAQPPVGRLRFRPPEYPAAPWEGVKSVKSQPSSCPQIKVTDLFHIGKEDCLDLHVYVPPNKTDERFPVMFWIFGGGYSLGDGFQEGLYAGANLARATNSIVVAVNYRVGPFGFLSHDALQREDEDGSTGNMGVRDQQAGLKWVQDNIEAFNGDPNRVTIFGESAGGFSVCWHLVNKNSKKLFHAAIIESGSCDAKQFFPKSIDQNRFGDLYASSIGCNSTKFNNNDTLLLNCLRNLKTTDIMNGVLNWFNPNWPYSKDGTTIDDNVPGHPSIEKYRKAIQIFDAASSRLSNILSAGLPSLAPVMPWGPVIDGTDVGTADMPLTLLENGKGNYVPTIWGSNKDEGSIFIPLAALIVKGGSYPLNSKTLNLTLLHFFYNNEKKVHDVLNLYPLGDYQNSQDSRAAAILRDCFFSCSMRRGARAMNSNGVKSWLYHFEFPLENPLYTLFGNFHASELGFVFDTWVNPLSKESKEMSNIFQKYWGNFANNGDVNGGGNTIWPHHNKTGDYNIVLDVPSSAQQHLYSDKCQYWDANM